jgi:hypothetical protein
MNKRKREAWRKHRKTLKKRKDKRKAERNR